MKEDLIHLINAFDDLKKYFHYTDDFFDWYIINDVQEFILWKEEILYELQEIYDNTKNMLIFETILLLKEGFGGIGDEETFDALSAKLRVILKKVDSICCDTNINLTKVEEIEKIKKPSKIFISHSTLDVEFVTAFVELLDDIGLDEEHIFCSSIPGYGIPLNKDIYEYLEDQFQNYNLYIIFALSENYYNSPACLNEMGATWILKSEYTTMLLPNFEFKEIKGAINPRKIGLKIDSDINAVKEKLGQLKDLLIKEFEISPISNTKWEKKRDKFINCILSN